MSVQDQGSATVLNETPDYRCDVFISIREGLEPYANRLEELIKSKGYECQTGVGMIDKPDWRGRMQKGIDNAVLTLVILCGETGLETKENTTAGQCDELRWSLRRDKRKNERADDDLRRTLTWYVLPPNAHYLADPTRREFKISQAAASPELKLELDEVTDNKFVCIDDVNAAPGTNSRSDTLSQLADEVHSAIRPKVEFRTGRVSQASPLLDTNNAIEHLEAELPTENERSSGFDLQHYLNSAFPNWLQGRPSPSHRGPSANEVSASDNAFAFKASRFMEPRLSNGTGRETESAFSLLLRQSRSVSRRSAQQKAIFLEGDVGSGKSVLLCAMAMMCAAKLDETLARRLKESFEGAPCDMADHLNDRGLGNDLTPLVVRAPQLAAEFIRDNDNPIPAALDAIAEFSGASELFGKNPLLLLVDGMDKVARRDQRLELTDALGRLPDRYSGDNDGRVFVVVTSRPGLENPCDRYLRFSVQPPSEDQIKRFLDTAIAQQRPDASGEELEYLMSLAREDVNDDGSRLLLSPLLLNAFCWKPSTETPTLPAFLAIIADQIFSSAAKLDVEEHGPREAFSPDKLSEFHERLAYEIFISDDEDLQYTLDIGRAKQVIRMVFEDTDDSSVYQNFLSDARRKVGLIETYHDNRLTIRPAPLLAFLAARYIARTDTDTKIYMLKSDDRGIGRWSDVLKYLFLIHMGKDNPSDAPLSLKSVETALKIPHEMLQRAQQESEEAPLAALKWLKATSRLWEDRVLTDIVAGDEKRRFEEIVDLTMEIYGSIRHSLKPHQLSDALLAIGEFGRFTNAQRARKLVHRLLRRASSGDSEEVDQTIDVHDWIKVETGSDCGGELSVSAWPVLVADYAEFVQDLEAARNAAPDAPEIRIWNHWPEREKDNHQASVDRLLFSQTRKLLDKWAESKPKLAHPIVCVNWFEAVAYCRWETYKLRRQGKKLDTIRLMSQREWLSIASEVSGGARHLIGSDDYTGSKDLLAHSGLDLQGAVPPGTFPPYGIEGLFDFGTNVRSWHVLPKVRTEFEEWFTRPIQNENASAAEAVERCIVFGFDALKPWERLLSMDDKGEQIRLDDRRRNVGIRPVKVRKAD